MDDIIFNIVYILVLLIALYLTYFVVKHKDIDKEIEQEEKENQYIKFNAVEDVIKFYSLYQHYNPKSPNIGIIGDKETFKYVVEAYLEDVPESAIIIQNDKHVRVIDKNIETTYVKIESTEDLIGKTFRKFI